MINSNNDNALTELEKLFCKHIEHPFYCTNDAAQWAIERIQELEDARNEYILLKEQFDSINKKLQSLDNKIKEKNE